ncbi:MAG TPA: SAF domain-containing protein [Acidimicrobiia bacterium]|nr:SAF domain-containing protein [Acidimicrobiia bacterium]
MFWLARPPYLRRALAALVVGAALWFELAPEAAVLHPFALRALPAGQPLTPTDFEWRPVPQGLLPSVEPSGNLAASMNPGEPLLPSLVGDTPHIPAGWWALEVPVPAGTVAGAEVRLAADSGSGTRLIPGLVVRVEEDDTFEGTTALVAVPESEAAAAVVATGQGTLAVLVGPGPEAASG